HSTVIPAGESDYTYSDTVSLQGLRRDLVLDFSVVDQSGIPVEGAEVAVVYTPSEGEETYYATTGGHVATTIEDVTTEQFRCGVAVAKDGYETYENIVTVPAGEAAFTYDTDARLTVKSGSRNLLLDLTITDAQGAPVAAQSVEAEYTKSDGTRATYAGVVPLRSSRMISAEVRVQDAGGSAVVAEEIACTYLQSSGKTNTMLATNSSILDDRGHSDCSVKAFTSRITVTAADYNTAVEEVPVEAGTEAVMIRKTVTLYPGSRSLHLDFAVRNEQGAAVEDAVVVIQYVKPDGSDENLQFTGGVHETFDNATTQGCTLLIMAQAEGSRVHMQQIAVPAGKEAYTYDTDVVLYYDYSPGITLDPPSPWTYTAHLGTLRNTG